MSVCIWSKSSRRKILIVDSSLYPARDESLETIHDLLRPTDYDAHVDHYSNVPTLSLDAYAALIIAPSAIDRQYDRKGHSYELQKKTDYLSILRSYRGHAIGICMGHQVLGMVFGSEYIRDREREVGDNLLVKLIEQDPLFRGLGDELIVKQAHNNSVTVPPGFRLLATSEKCRNQVMKHATLPLYGSQFHIERDERAFYNFVDTIAASISSSSIP